MVNWPRLFVYHQKQDWPACIDQLELIADPRQRPLEPELKPRIEKVIRDFHAGKQEDLAKEIRHIVELGKQLKYL